MPCVWRVWRRKAWHYRSVIASASALTRRKLVSTDNVYRMCNQWLGVFGNEIQRCRAKRNPRVHYLSRVANGLLGVTAMVAWQSALLAAAASYIGGLINERRMAYKHARAWRWYGINMAASNVMA